MGRLLHAEVYRITHSPAGWALTIVLLALAYLTRQRAGLFSEMDADYVFYFVFCNPIPLLWIGTLLTAFSFQECFGSRTFQGAVFSGESRLAIVVSHMFPYYLWGGLINLVSMLAIFLRNGVFLRMGTITVLFFLSRMLLHILFCMVLMTLPMCFAFLFRDVLYGMILNGGVAFFTQVLLERLTVEENPLLYRLHPVFQMVEAALWMEDAHPSRLFAIICELFFLLIAGLFLSLFLFQKTELK